MQRDYKQRNNNQRDDKQQDRRPLDLLTKFRDSTVFVQLRGTREYKGTLRGYDVHMNLVLDDTKEIEDNKTIRILGRTIIRGDNVVFISP